jgi:outer membrane lipoprotein carrier protein
LDGTVPEKGFCPRTAPFILHCLIAMSCLRSALLTVLLLAILVPSAGWAQTADSTSLLPAIQQRYEQLDGLRATFTQEIRSDFASGSTRMQGTLLLKQEKYRVETDEQTLVTDGTTTWIYTPADQQVIINHADQDASTLSPETFFTDYADHYRVVRTEEVWQNGVRHRKLRLTPTSSQTLFREVTLWVRPNDPIVTRLRVTDRDGSEITISLEDIDLNPGLRASDFTFTPPEYADVVDLRSS